MDQGTQPLWVLWGDSSAASLYTGIRGLQQRSGKMRLAQFTSSACPPMAGFAGPNPACTYNNDWALASIARLKPDTVLMAAMWHEYDKANLPATLARLKALGVRRVVMLGPPPSWKDTPSRIVFNLWRDDPLHATPPPRLDYTKYGMGQDAAAGGADYRTATAEVLLRDLAKQTGVEYISLTEVLCNEDGCLTRSDSKSGETFYLDIVHLTPAGSRFTADLIAKQLLQDSP